ncbi:MAG: DUF4295 domain-containing protein [Amoebophilaceae bacterium]|jgi:hypothetical protein|nr:DUF4295 domain-containing protein [Amoebophilaceae bacterium]
MAKKVVASFQKTGGKSLSKIIRSVRSVKTGAYTFRAEMVSVEAVKEILSKKA